MPKRNLRNLKLRAIAAVDNPCQEHAKAMILKRAFSADERQAMAGRGEAMPDGGFPIANASDLENAIQAYGRAKDPAKAKAHIISRARALDALDKLPEAWSVKKIAGEIAKYICQDDGAHSFQECLDDSKFDQNIWPCVDALSQSIRSIVGDGSLTGAERDTQIQSSVDQFLSAVRDLSPEVSKRLEPLVRKEGRSMPKTVEELEKEVGDLTGQLTSANAIVASEKARADKAEGELTAERTAHGETKKQLVTATDETIKVGDTEIKKSVIGPDQFAMAKALADDRDHAVLEKRADGEFRHVVGTASEKALILKSVNGRGEDDPLKKALLAVLTSAEKMAKLGFENLGSRGESDPDVKKARQTYEGRVAEIQKRDECNRAQAMSKARREFQDDWAAAYPDEAERELGAN